MTQKRRLVLGLLVLLALIGAACGEPDPTSTPPPDENLSAKQMLGRS